MSSRKIYGSGRIEVEKRIREWQESLDKEGMEKSEKPKIDMRPKFEGICAVCGTKIQVPFEPDPSRPIYCKDHLGMAGQYRRPQAPTVRSPRPQSFSRSEKSFVSLRSLRRQPIAPMKTENKDNLTALREALKKSLAKPKEEKKEQEQEEKTKTLKPGDKIEL